MGDYFFDTYALVELLKGNPAYDSYRQGVRIVTTQFNLMEFHYALLRLQGDIVANYWYDFFSRFVIPVSDSLVKKANQFRLSLKERRLSYVDCIGYVLAQEHGVKFLTGDTAFQDLPFVEFVR